MGTFADDIHGLECQQKKFMIGTAGYVRMPILRRNGGKAMDKKAYTPVAAEVILEGKEAKENGEQTVYEWICRKLEEEGKQPNGEEGE